VTRLLKTSKDRCGSQISSCTMFTRLIPFLATLSFIQTGVPRADAEKFTRGTERMPLAPDLKAGDYVWKPGVSPAGPVVVIVSVPEQTLYVYRNGVRIGRSTVSRRVIALQRVYLRSLRRMSSTLPAYTKAHRCLICALQHFPGDFHAVKKVSFPQKKRIRVR